MKQEQQSERKREIPGSSISPAGPHPTFDAFPFSESFFYSPTIYTTHPISLYFLSLFVFMSVFSLLAMPLSHKTARINDANMRFLRITNTET